MNTIALDEINNIDCAIKNLEISSRALSNFVDSNDNMNSELSHMLSMMALEMRSQSNDLQNLQYGWW